MNAVQFTISDIEGSRNRSKVVRLLQIFYSHNAPVKNRDKISY
jgi:hypothetical protein